MQTSKTTSHDKSRDWLRRYLSPRDAATFLGVPLSRVYDLSYRRQIRVFKVGKSLRFLVSDLERFARLGERPALSEVRSREDDNV